LAVLSPLLDRVISRTIVYGAVTVILFAAYAGLVLAGQAVFSSFAGGGDLAIAVSTLVVAALFLPLRSGVQRVVDRRFQPSGTVSFLFTDVEGSTSLLCRLGAERYGKLLARHRALLRAAFAAERGYEVDCEGDSFFVAFPTAGEAVSAATNAQQALATEHWPDGEAVWVRMGVHTGEPMLAPPKYVGLDVHKAARVMQAGHGGQVLVSQETRGFLDQHFQLRDLGVHRLKDLGSATRLYQLEVEGLPSEFPALKTLANRPASLTVQPSRLIGRGAEVAERFGDLRAELVPLSPVELH